MSASMNAHRVTWVLTAMVLLLASVIVVANWQLGEILSKKVEATNQLKEEARKSVNDLEQAKSLELYEKSHQDDIQKAATLVAESRTYQYQNQIINDINNFAAQSHIEILGFSFPEDAIANAKQTVPGLKSIPVTISLRTPLQYYSYLEFIRLIENNRTKMQITNTTVAPDSELTNHIDTNSIELEVYVR